MTLKELKERVMFQTNNDAEDLGDFEPHLTAYLNEGYDCLAFAWAGEHVSAESERFSPLVHDKSSPALPAWAHAALADFAAWRLYRNGSAPKQSRGLQFLTAFEDARRRLRAEPEGRGGAITRFYHLPK